MTKGKNGQQRALEIIESVKAWIKERNIRLDWHEYAYNNRINRSVLAEELDFAMRACTQNKNLRAILDECDTRWFKSEAADKTAHEAARERAQGQTSRISSENSELQKRIVELEVENRQLRLELNGFKEQQALLECGAAGFKL
ncbi:hypothetical protein [Gallionella capsiferriformans]|jgi:hypothetical protein|uniref:Uncharacterized protein n=1 Tax=Gallionella capsiferriformans (strain ES-2) TaxID=395494 RepID=D9SJZ5_GALCS|nr:hypothetical protein [Gallionella capsiferriformans]ADL56407.1 hypothetical protein Galf_2405 [Gallionella capsiferriformans ES-2]